MIGGALLLVVLASAIALAVVVTIAALVWRRAPPDDGRFDAVKQLAAAEGMRFSHGRTTSMTGPFRGRSVTVRWKTNPERTEITVATPVRSMEARASADAGKSVMLRTGDPGFDDAVAVRGRDVSALLALLDDETRTTLRALVANGGCVEPGAVIVKHAAQLLAPMPLADAISGCIAFAHTLEGLEAKEIPARLASIAGGDPVAGMRRRATEILVEKYKSTVYAAEAARRAIADPDSGVRAQAAPLAESGDADVALAAAVRNERASEKERRDALARSAAVLDRDDMIALYEVALASRIPALQRDGITGFARLRHGAGIPRLAMLITETDDEEVLLSLADALARIPGIGGEEALLSMLERKEPAVQTAAAVSLGEIGSPSSIAKLQPFAAQVVGSPELRESAANAIAAIRTRHPEAAMITLPRKDRV